MLEAKSLSKAVVPSSLIENPSPGSLQSTRLALHVSEDCSSCWVYIASGCRIYKLQVMNSLMVNRCPHRSEIQSIVLAETESTGYSVLGTVDSYGHLIVSKLDTTGRDVERLTYSVLPRDCGIGEGGWAGALLQSNTMVYGTEQLLHVASAKPLIVYDQDIHVRTLCTLWYPSSLNFTKSSHYGNEGSILAITEGSQLTIWDLRMKENGGCLQRICGSLGDAFYAVCSSSTGNIAVGGADRTVTIYDPRRWSALSRWVHCSKYEITGLAFSSVDSDYIYIQGVDYEVISGFFT
ncbi:unnamed protein product [Prunus armeniaca]